MEFKTPFSTNFLCQTRDAHRFKCEIYREMWIIRTNVTTDNLVLCYEQNRESTKRYSRRKVERRHDKFEDSGLNNWNTRKSTKGGTELGVRKGKRTILASHTRCKRSMETTLGIKVMKLVESLIGWEVTVGQGSEEQDKSSDIEQQPPFGDRKISNIQPENRGGVTKPTGTSYNFDKVLRGASDGRFGK